MYWGAFHFGSEFFYKQELFRGTLLLFLTDSLVTIDPLHWMAGIILPPIEFHPNTYMMSLTKGKF